MLKGYKKTKSDHYDSNVLIPLKSSKIGSGAEVVVEARLVEDSQAELKPI